MSTDVNAPAAWRLAGEMLRRPFPLRARVLVPAVALMVIVPFYLVIPSLTRGWTLHQPELALDRLVPVSPVWAVVYISYFGFPLLALLLIRQEELLRRTFLAWLAAWLTGYATFFLYPTILPRPTGELGLGFFPWFLQQVWDGDAPRNCFPSLHVASPFIAAFAIWRVHRGAGWAVGVWASLVALSTLFTKQHYVADVIAGIALAAVAGAIFLRNCPREPISADERRAIPVLVVGSVMVYLLAIAGLWVGWRLR